MNEEYWGIDDFAFVDVMALCSGMRPLVMVDYGGKMPELQEHLCSLLEVIRKVLLLICSTLSRFQIIRQLNTFVW